MNEMLGHALGVSIQNSLSEYKRGVGEDLTLCLLVRLCVSLTLSLIHSAIYGSIHNKLIVPKTMPPGPGKYCEYCPHTNLRVQLSLCI